MVKYDESANSLVSSVIEYRFHDKNVENCMLVKQSCRLKKFKFKLFISSAYISKQHEFENYKT